MSQGPIVFENSKNESLQRHAVSEMAEMGHYDTIQILKRRIGKNDEARDECRGPLHVHSFISKNQFKIKL